MAVSWPLAGRAYPNAHRREIRLCRALPRAARAPPANAAAAGRHAWLLQRGGQPDRPRRPGGMTRRRPAAARCREGRIKGQRRRRRRRRHGPRRRRLPACRGRSGVGQVGGVRRQGEQQSRRLLMGRRGFLFAARSAATAAESARETARTGTLGIGNKHSYMWCHLAPRAGRPAGAGPAQRRQVRSDAGRSCCQGGVAEADPAGRAGQPQWAQPWSSVQQADVPAGTPLHRPGNLQQTLEERGGGGGRRLFDSASSP